MSAPVPAPERRPLEVATIPLTGVHLIEASAGTGKTFTITSLVLRMIVEEERPIDSILAVTFTNAATAELKERVLARLEQARVSLRAPVVETNDPIVQRFAALPDRERVQGLLDRAARDADRAAIFTIHGFAARLLKDHAFESGAREDTELVGDQRALVQDVVTDFWTSRVATLPRGTFEQLGGSWFYSQLTRVGLAAAAAFDVPLVPLEDAVDIEESERAITEVFGRARAAFAEGGAEVFHLLANSTSLNRNKMRPASIEADYRKYLAYFQRGQPNLGHPGSDRFTARKVADSHKKNAARVDHPLLHLLEELHDAYQICALAARQFADRLRAELCDIVVRRVRQEHERFGTQSFDGLLTDVSIALRDPVRSQRLSREVRAQFPVAMIDEFQDTDPVQYEIFRRLYVTDEEGSDFHGSSGPDGQNAAPVGRTALYLIGDPKQSIYAFRGADVQTYLAATRHATGGVWTLTTSYRASPRLVRAQNALFQAPRDAFCVPGIGYDPVDARPGARDVLLDASGEPLPGIRIASVEHNDDGLWLRSAADEVARFLEAGHTIDGAPVSPAHLAVLTRTNRQAQDIQAHLRKLGIPAVMHGDRSVFESDEALELRRVLEALFEPGHRTLSRTALATRLLGLDAETLGGLEEDHQQLEVWTTRLRSWGHLWQARGISHAFEALSAETNLIERTLADRDGERRMTNLRHLLELLHEAESREHLGAAGLIRYLEGAIADPVGHAMAAEARQLRLESDADAVTLTTAHKSKGLEYDVVFLPTLGLSDKKFSDEAFRYFDEEQKSCLFEMRQKESRGDSDEIHELEQRQESLRLCYVALTRAKHHAFVLTGASKGFSALLYLLHERNSGDPGGLESLSHRLKKLDGSLRQEEIRALCARSDGALAWQVLGDEPGPSFSRRRTASTLVAPPARPTLIESERTSSFSAMTKDSGLSRAAREGRDIDEGTDEASSDSALPTMAAPADQTRAVLADFPRGARPGDALHAIFEHSPFSEGTRKDRAGVVERELTRRGFSTEHRQAAAVALEDVLETPLAREGELGSFRLGQLGREHRSAEMEFSMPVGSLERRFSPARLARALRAPDAGAVFTEDYLALVESLPFSAWSGFLRGFIDLVFVHEGKLYGLDYKSNHLGDDYADYTPGALKQAMQEHHYLLQALFYAVAIHRYGRTRIADYDYDRHFGGMTYLFLRGMHPSRAGQGVFFHRPSRSLIESLSDALTEGQ